MKYCKNCNVKVEANRNYCPLCFREIVSDGVENQGEPLFVERTKNETFARNNSFILRLFVFISFCIVSICGLINYLTSDHFSWSILVLACVVYVWILVAHTITSRRGPFEKIFLQVGALMFILWACEYISGSKDQHWLVNYVFPSISMATVATMIMITFIRKDKSWTLAFASITALLTIVALLILFYHYGHYQQLFIISVINIVFCLISLLGYLTFAYNTIKTEFLKKFHL